MNHDFIDRLRTQTKTLHQQAHTLSFFRELANGHLAIESYVGLLRCLAIVRGALERQRGAVGDKTAHVFGPDRPGGQLLRLMPTRLPAILNDLQYFSNTIVRDVVPAVRAALRSADTIMISVDCGR